MSEPGSKGHQRGIAIAIAGLFALVMICFGLWSIYNGYYAASTKRGVLVTLEGDSARWLGGLQICLGMCFLIIAMPNKTIALRWGLAWLSLAAACVALAIHYK